MDKVLIEVGITEGVLPPHGRPANGSGAVVEFVGVVRGEEQGRPIRALEYQAYQPMAGREIERVIRELLAEFPCTSVRVLHRTGVIPVGECAISLQVAALHRGPAFAFAGAFIDRLKQDVPIWKIKAIPA